MMKDLLPHDSYAQQLFFFTTQLAALQKKRKNLGWIRLVVFLATIYLAYLVFVSYGIAGLIPTIVGIALLLYLVSVDAENNRRIRNVKTLIQVNEAELQALQHHFQDREDGSSMAPPEHAYAHDLDIFGRSSIYQWASRCYTEQGRQRLSGNLLYPLPVSEASARQEAVKELAANLQWRQQWQAYAMQTTVTRRTEERITTWLAEKEEHFSAPAWTLLLPAYSVLTLGSAVAAVLGYIPAAMFSMLFMTYLIISLLLSRHALRPYVYLNGIVKEAATLQSLVEWLETLQPNTAWLRNWQAEIKNGNISPGQELKNLKAILDRFDLRNSIIGFLFLNPFLLWDVRQMMALNKWRQRNKELVPKWFAAVAEMEVVHSISTLHFNQPDWCFPGFTSAHFTLSGKNIGHPLLPKEQRVNNDFDLRGVAKIGLITGSNMAGKSTFLRSLGVNMVLAQMGSPVCASSFMLSPVKLVSSMRIADNLAENTSTFYAELKKLRTIIEMVKTKEPLFILLDEILRGTNSYDRHTGAAALIRQLIRENAVAVIATHDVELAQMETTYPDAIRNYHFDVQIEGEELYFDYKLKEGVCTSLNASLLMKKIGIALE